MSTFATQLAAIKCNRRGCAVPPQSLLLPCLNPACNKGMHLVCCQKYVFGVHTLEPLVSPDPSTHAVVCTKKCYLKVAKKLVPTTGSTPATVPAHLLAPVPSNSRLPWNKDGKLGPQDPNHSERILVDWLMTPGNYEKYRGHNNKGVRKKDFARIISERINAAGVRKERTYKDVVNKIDSLQKNFKDAVDWTHTKTGEGLLETDTCSYEQKVLKFCPYYYDIYDIFQDRANARPHFTTDNLFHSNSETSIMNGSNGDEDILSVHTAVRSVVDHEETSTEVDGTDQDNDDESTAGESRASSKGDENRPTKKKKEKKSSSKAATKKGMEKDDSIIGKTEGNKENTAPKTVLKTRPSSVPLSVRKKKEAPAGKLRKKQKTDLDDVFSIEVMKCFSQTNDKKEATELFRSKELQRHHKAMEVWLSESRSSRSSRVTSTSSLEQYHQLKAKFEPGFIEAVSPEMKVFIDADNIISVGRDNGNDSSVNT